MCQPSISGESQDISSGMFALNMPVHVDAEARLSPLLFSLFSANVRVEFSALCLFSSGTYTYRSLWSGVTVRVWKIWW